MRIRASCPTSIRVRSRLVILKQQRWWTSLVSSSMSRPSTSWGQSSNLAMSSCQSSTSPEMSTLCSSLFNRHKNAAHTFETPLTLIWLRCCLRPKTCPIVISRLWLRQSLSILKLVTRILEKPTGDFSRKKLGAIGTSLTDSKKKQLRLKLSLSKSGKIISSLWSPLRWRG